MLLAGLVILAHTVIPHHHLNDDLFLGDSALLEHVNSPAHNNDFECLISNKLFVDKSSQFKIKKQQQVNLLLFVPETEKKKTCIFSSGEFIFTGFSRTNSPVTLLTEKPLRAPPTEKA